MPWEVWDPFGEMKRFRKEMDRVFENFFRSEKKLFGKRLEIRAPLTDIQETGKEVIVKAEMPGIDKKDIKIKVTDNIIEIKAEKKEEAEVKKKGFFRQERSYKGFHRAMTLPAEVVAGKTRAQYKNGILTVTMPKVKQIKKAKVKRIEIRSLFYFYIFY